MALRKHDFPILEFDDAPNGVMHAPDLLARTAPTEHCVVTFFQDSINSLLDEGRLTRFTDLKSEAGRHPVYLMDVNGKQVALFHPMLGGPYAAGFLEEAIALGFSKFIACGGAGVLSKDIVVGHLVVPSEALRQEGASYHYLPPSRTVAIDPLAVSAIELTLREEKVPYLKGMTWTTDAIYRETREMIQYRKSEGCLTVEMECASFAAVAAFRGATFGQILYGGDDISQEVWMSRNWHSRKDIRKDLVLLAAKACLRL